MRIDVKGVRWRLWLIRLHRDLGYFFVGLTLIYGISGVAVNHRRHWDYDHARTTNATQVGTPPDLVGTAEVSAADEEQLVGVILERLRREQRPRLVVWRSPRHLTLFFGPGEEDLVDYDPVTGTATESRRERRWVYWLNRIHLNDHNPAWIWFADLFALGLVFLAGSGAVMLKGKNGLMRRGWWLMSLGLACPVAVLLFG